MERYLQDFEVEKLKLTINRVGCYSEDGVGFAFNRISRPFLEFWRKKTVLPSVSILFSRHKMVLEPMAVPFSDSLFEIILRIFLGIFEGLIKLLGYRVTSPGRVF